MLVDEEQRVIIRSAKITEFIQALFLHTFHSQYELE